MVYCLIPLAVLGVVILLERIVHPRPSMSRREAGWLAALPIAHRGLYGGERKIPENSLAAFSRAVGEGYAIELDVQLSKDGNVVVFHDYDLSRMTGAAGYIKDMDWAELQNLKLAGSTEGIPLLKQVLSSVAGQAPLLIEIKNEGKTGPLEQEVIAALADYQGEYAVESFNPFVLSYFSKHAPDIIRGQLASNFKNDSLARWKKFLLRNLLLNFLSKPAFVAYEYGALPQRFARRVKKRGLLLLAWTIKTAEDFDRAKQQYDNVIFEGFLAPK